MSLKLVSNQALLVETTSIKSTRSIMLGQVANSKGNEWMISSYRAWQQRSPLASEPQRVSSSMLRLVNRMNPNETRMNSVMAFSFRIVVILLTLIMLGKGR
jgi:hypothetical protein